MYKVLSETQAYKKIPIISNFVDEQGVDHMKEMIQENYNRIKAEAKQIVADKLERIRNDSNPFFLVYLHDLVANSL